MTARILLIEDNPTNMELMVYLVEAAGYTVLAAHDGEEGLAVARRERPDLIACDIQMPGMNGYQVAEALKADPELRHIPLVAVTAFAMVGDREKAYAAGFDGYVSKPIEPTTFVQELGEHLVAGSGDRGAPGAEAARGNLPALPPAAPRVLVVDNDKANRELATAALGYAGYRVDAVSDPDVAFARALDHPPDVILSDVCMPTMSGLDFLRKIKENTKLQAIPFIFVSATATDERTRREALALGADQYLFRPIEIEVLLEAVDMSLRKGRGTVA